MSRYYDVHFNSEAEMCAEFIASLPTEWKAYPETAGFDILLVRIADGLQIGVQAKLALNAKVIDQVIDPISHWRVLGEAPDCRAVLVPLYATYSLGSICSLLGITVIRIGIDPARHGRGRLWVNPALPDPSHNAWGSDRDWHEWAPAKRCELPDYVPDVSAGKSSPVALTTWKVKAIKLLILLDRRGYVTRDDFKHLQLDASRWLAAPAGWLAKGPVRGQWVRGSYIPDLRAQHPVNYPAIEADFEKWAPPADRKAGK